MKLEVSAIITFPMSESSQKAITRAKIIHELAQEKLPEEERKPFHIMHFYELDVVERELQENANKAREVFEEQLKHMGIKSVHMDINIADTEFQFRTLFTK